MNWASVRTAQAIPAKKIGIHSNASGHPCEKNLHPFTQLGLSAQKKFASVRTAWAIREKKGVIHSKKLSSVQTAQAIC